MSYYEFLLAVHIICVALWFGGGVMLHVLGRRAMRQGGDQMVHFTSESAWFGPRFFAPLAGVLLIAGILLVDEAGYEQSELFITLGYVGWLIGAGIGMAVYPRIERELTAAAKAEGNDSPKVTELFKRYAMVSSIEVLVLLLVIIDMTAKPGFP